MRDNEKDRMNGSEKERKKERKKSPHKDMKQKSTYKKKKNTNQAEKDERLNNYFLCLMAYQPSRVIWCQSLPSRRTVVAPFNL